MNNKNQNTDGIKIICQNKKARHNYEIVDTMETGVVLQGTEVKALREGKASMADCYAVVDREQVYMLHCHISHYTPAHAFNHDPMRKRKLLLHKKEIGKLIGTTQEKGYNLIPLKLYFKNGKVKVELAIGKGKKSHDKRETIKKREADREIARAMKRDKP